MSRSVIKKVFVFVLPAALAGAAVAYWYNLNRPQHLQQLKNPPLLSSFTTKGTSSRLIEVELKYDQVQSHDENVEVKAYVTMPFDWVGPVRFRWKIGENVEVVEGLLTGALENFQKGEAKLLTIQVKGFGKESNRHIAFEVTGLYHGRGIYGEALMASDIENTFENTVQNVERIKAEQN